MHKTLKHDLNTWDITDSFHCLSPSTAYISFVSLHTVLVDDHILLSVSAVDTGGGDYYYLVFKLF